MSFPDDYDAKIRIWSRNARTYRLPRMTGLPRFGSRRFKSHLELNRWKEEYLKEIARAGGVRRTSLMSRCCHWEETAGRPIDEADIKFLKEKLKITKQENNPQ